MSETTSRTYLERYAEREARLSFRLDTCFDHVVVVPAYDEDSSLLDGLETACGEHAGKALIVLVVNCAEDAEGDAALRTAELVANLRAQASSEEQKSKVPPIYLLRIRSLWVLLVDRASPAFQLPPKEGVGLARRIGCDIALRLGAEGFIRSPWIASTDADALLPTDYFDTLTAQLPTASAILFPFAHTPPATDATESSGKSPEAIFQATLLLECSLRYLVLGLHSAGSPYAFHTIGSTLSISRRTYAEVRGFPRLLAGEDFHILNKLAKVGPIRRVASTPIRIRSRISERTPFGTGKSVFSLLNSDAEVPAASRQPRAFYHPTVFAALRLWHGLLADLALRPEANAWEQAEPHGVPAHLVGALSALWNDKSLRSQLENALRQRKTPEQRLSHVFTQFDALSGVQLIRRLNEACPPLEWQEALRLAPFIEPGLGSRSLADWAEQLRSQEAQLPREIGPTCFRQMS
ncbi:MAG: hypothetical protein SFV15_05200 [Polyangiaceae bacterium]|nr:hypothetical protein [Polyangiaceae bacterium]